LDFIADALDLFVFFGALERLAVADERAIGPAAFFISVGKVLDNGGIVVRDLDRSL
jgi:predicted TPR repeat methyltransferase